MNWAHWLTSRPTHLRRRIRRSPTCLLLPCRERPSTHQEREYLKVCPFVPLNAGVGCLSEHIPRSGAQAIVGAARNTRDIRWGTRIGLRPSQRALVTRRLAIPPCLQVSSLRCCGGLRPADRCSKVSAAIVSSPKHPVLNRPFAPAPSSPPPSPSRPAPACNCAACAAGQPVRHGTAGSGPDRRRPWPATAGAISR